MSYLSRTWARRPRLFKFVAGVLAWVVVMVFLTLALRIAGSLSWTHAFLATVREWLPWAALSPLIFWLAAKFPIDGKSWPWALPLHALYSVLAVAIAEFIVGGILVPVIPQIGRPGDLTPASDLPGPPPSLMWLQPPPPRADSGAPALAAPPEGPPPPFREMFLRRLSVGLPVYWGLVILQHALLFYRRYRDSQHEALKMEKNLARAQLDSLKMQLQPHFLFNALNAISTLVHSDPDKAEKMIGHLGHLLRSFLDEQTGNEVTVSVECRLLEAYLNIEKVRFGDRLNYREFIEPGAENALVPIMLLQPLVENAVRHGIEPKSTPGEISLSITRREDRLQILLKDDGVGRRGSSRRGHGIGLSNARARLAALSGSDGYELHVKSRAEGGTVIEISLPFRISRTPSSVLA